MPRRNFRQTFERVQLRELIVIKAMARAPLIAKNFAIITDIAAQSRVSRRACIWIENCQGSRKSRRKREHDRTIGEKVWRICGFDPIVMCVCLFTGNSRGPGDCRTVLGELSVMASRRCAGAQ